MKIHHAEFISGAAKPGQFPMTNLPEIAFSGRSNVGKSSLINSFVHRKNLARTSSTPGKTSEINFFNIENRWALADMPGFGFTKRGVERRRDWAELNFSYLENRHELKLVCCLIDSRHDPMEMDLLFIEWLENHKKDYIIILTKCDKLKKGAIENRKEQLDSLVAECNYCQDVLPYSSVKDIGRSELMALIKRFGK